ncbi:MAG: DNA polymerase III subunit delta [Chloroflexota bacterium]|nr:DNA polymerase III subunit delta [Chloroflexota bacterium]
MIHFLSGPDGFTLQATVQRLLRGALPPDVADLNTTRLSASEVTLDGLRFACEAAPFLAERRVVVVDGLFTRLGRSRGRADKRDDKRDEKGEQRAERETGLAAAVAGYLPQVPLSTLLIFVEAEVPPKTGALAKALTEAGAKQQFFPVLAGMPLVRWIRERVQTSGAAIDDAAAELLASFVGGDLRVLANEVSKLATYVGPGQPIGVADVQTLVSQAAEANIFDCVDAIGQGDARRALGSLHVLLEHGERAERILALISRQVRLLLQAKDLSQRGESSEGIGRALGLSPFPLRKVLDQMRLFELTGLEGMLRRVLEADIHIKTGLHESGLALELLLAELASVARTPRGRPVRPISTGATNGPPRQRWPAATTPRRSPPGR